MGYILGTWLLGQQVLRVGITDILGIANIINITDIADIVTDITDIVMDVVDIVNIAVETGRRVQGVTEVSCDRV